MADMADIDTDSPTTWERIQTIVAAPLAVAAALFIVLSAPEKEVPPVKGGHPGSFTAPASWLAPTSIEVQRSPETEGEQEVTVTVVVNQQVDGAWKPYFNSASTTTVLSGEPSTSVVLFEPPNLPSSGVFEIGAVVQWFSGDTSLGWTSVGLSDPSSVVK